MTVKCNNIELIILPGLANKQFGLEIKVLGEISHQNILPIIGYSNDGPYKCLIYTFMPNGSLEDALQCKVCSTMPFIVVLSYY